MEPLLIIKKIFFTATAIYLSDDFVDVAEASVALNGMKITSLQRFPLARNVKGSAYVDVSTQIDRMLSKVFAKDDDKPCRIAVNVKNNHLLLRRFPIRDVSRGELDQVVAFEAQKYIPSLIDNLTYGFKAYSRGAGLQEIVFAASETKNVHEITDYFNERQILPSTIEPVPILLARSLKLKKDLKKDGAYIFIHYEPANKIILCEISHQYPYFFRELTIAGEGEEARDAGQKNAELNYPTLKSVWPNIEREVIGGIDYLRKETTEKVDKIFISGFAHSPDETDLAQEFGIPFERLDLSFFKGLEDENKDRYLPVLMLLHDSQKKPFLNMAPKEIVRSDLWSLKSVAIKSLGIFFAIIMIHSFLAGINVQKSWKVEKAKKGFDKYGSINTSATKEDVLNYRNAIIEKAAFANSLVERKHYLAEKMEQLEELLPPESWLEHLNYTNKADAPNSFFLEVAGSIFGSAAQGAADINKIFESMKQDKKLMRGFKEAELVSVEKKELFGREVTEFQIVLKSTL